jgi:hypothetical protein
MRGSAQTPIPIRPNWYFLFYPVLFSGADLALEVERCISHEAVRPARS